MRPGASPSLRTWPATFVFAVRQLVKRPAFGALAILTLSLGIGGTVALFSVVNGIMLRPLPFATEDRIVTFWSDYNWRGVEFDFVKERAQAYERLAAFSTSSGAMRIGDETSVLSSAVSSVELFDVLGARPMMGRTFRVGEDRPGAEPVMVLSHSTWQRELSADPDVIGRRVLVDGAPVTVIGVMPEDFYFPTPEYQAWLPLDLDPESSNYQGNGFLVLLGRLRPAVSPELVQDDLAGITSALGERFTYPEAWDKTKGAYVLPIREYLLGDATPALLLLLGAVGLLLLMACANVTALLLTRTADRSGEMAVRTALGAGRGRLARQILSESVVLGVLAGGVGAVLAVSLFDVLVAMLPLENGFGDTLALDWTTLASSLGLAVAVGATIAMLPIRALLRGQIDGALAGERGESGGARGGTRMQGALVMAEVLLAVMLVTGATLLVRSVAHLRTLDSGLDADNVLVMNVLTTPEEMTPDVTRLFFDELVVRTAALPGVRSAAITNRLPVRDGGYQGTVSVEDRPDLEGVRRPNSYYRTATLDFFETMGMRIVRGRAFDVGDAWGALQVAIVSEAFAARMWPAEDPIGRRISNSFDRGRDVWLTVIGVVSDSRVQGLVGEMPMVTYRPQAQLSSVDPGGLLVVKTGVESFSLVDPVRSLVQELDSRVALADVTTMDDVVESAMGEPLRLRFFLSLFGGLGLVLGTIGVYGVVAYSVSRRRAELGIRAALGADPRRLLTSVVGGGLVPVVLGVAGGIVGSLALSRVVASFLFGVQPTDPASFAVAGGVLLLAGVCAALVPAYRASVVDPVEALRAE